MSDLAPKEVLDRLPERRQHLFRYLHATVRSLIQRGDWKPGEPVMKIVTATLKLLGKEALADLGAVLKEYGVEKLALQVSVLSSVFANAVEDPGMQQVVSGLARSTVDWLRGKQEAK